MMKNIITCIFGCLLIVGSVRSDDCQNFKDDESKTFAQLDNRIQEEYMFQPPEMDKPHGPGDMKRFEQLQLVKLLELLNLPEDLENRFIPLFRTHRKNHKKIKDKEDLIIKQLALEIKKSNSDEKAILNYIDQIKNNENEMKQETDRFLSEIEKMLTPIQMGKVYVFKARFGAEVLGKMRDFRKRKGGMGPNHNFDPNPRDSN